MTGLTFDKKFLSNIKAQFSNYELLVVFEHKYWKIAIVFLRNTQKLAIKYKK